MRFVDATIKKEILVPECQLVRQLTEFVMTGGYTAMS